MLGDKIRIYRSLGGFRIETLANKLGITRQTLTKWEKGITIPDVISMKKISDILGVPMEKFIAGIEEEEQKKETLGFAELPKEKQQFGPVERYFWGEVTIGRDRKIEIPQRAMKKMGIKPGEKLLLLGDFERGLELVYEDILWEGRRNKMKEDLMNELINEPEFDMVDDELEMD